MTKDVEFGVTIKWDIPLLGGYNYTFFKNAELGYIVGEAGLCWKTTDGGANWQTVSNAPANLDIQRIYFNNNLMWMVGKVGRGKGKIYSIIE